MLTIPTSHTLRSCLVPSVWVLAISMIIGMDEALASRGWLPKWMQIQHLDTGASQLLHGQHIS